MMRDERSRQSRLVLALAAPACAALVCAALAYTLASAAPGALEPTSSKVWQPLGHYSPLADRAETEPNNTIETADTLACGDVLRPASISPREDLDYVVFTANAGDVITVGTSADGVDGQLDDSVITLFDSGGNSLAIDDDSGPGRYSLLVYTALTTGTYYARVSGYDALGSGDYQAFLRCTPAPDPTCNLIGFDSLTAALPDSVDITDGDPSGVTVGPLAVPNDGQYLRDVVLGLNIRHPHVGDLTVTLTYDVECDSAPEASARVLCRPGRSGCETGSDTGCPANLTRERWVYLNDAASAEIGLVPYGCGDTNYDIQGGCYRPSSTGEPLAVFARLPRGGCFRLVLSDAVTYDSGTLWGWTVYTASSPTAVTPVSWSQAKSLYR